MKKSYIAKQAIIDEIKSKIAKAKSIVFIDYRGLNVSATTELRAEMRKNNVDYKVYKNKLVLRAFNEAGIKNCGLEEDLQYTLAVAFGYDDEVAPAKILAEAIAKNNKMELKFGFLGKDKMDSVKVTALSKIPSREVLLSKLVFMLQSPITRLAMTIKAIAEKQA